MTEEQELVPEDDAIIGQALKWSALAVVVIGAVVAIALQFTGDEIEPEVVLPKEAGAISDRVVDAAQLPVVRFTEITRAAGIDFVHESGARGEKLLPETMGGGAAFFDRDGDGDQDLLFVNGAVLSPDSDQVDAENRLYLNDGAGNFTDATEGSGLEGRGYGMGVAVGDFDGDGRVDVFTTGVGENHLYQNGADGFRDVTASARVAGDASQWTTSAGFFDYDKDGDLDLFVCRYVNWTRDLDLALAFTLNGRDRAYGPPMNFPGAFSTLYRNDGDGTFEDVSKAAGIQVSNPSTGEPMGKALGVSFVDFDGDGWLDVFVANDTIQNFLYRNRGDGTFEECGAALGVGFDGNGKATGAMGIDAADYRNDGGLGVCIGNFANEMSSLYVLNERSRSFSDDAMGEGIGSPSRQRLSFGLFFFDYDLNGRLDLLQANGHLEESIQEVQPSQSYHQPPQLFWNAGAEQRSVFLEVSNASAGDLDRKLAGRGSAYADIDGDGDLDVLLVQVGGPPVLLRNDQELGHHWLTVRLEDRGPNTQAIGAQVVLKTESGSMRRMVTPTRGYLSQSTLDVTFGLGETTAVESLEVVWPDGERQLVDVPGLDRELVVRR
ncbi:MAG: CRTAC1 family protein [Planctomycetota bacterium]